MLERHLEEPGTERNGLAGNGDQTVPNGGQAKPQESRFHLPCKHRSRLCIDDMECIFAERLRFVFINFIILTAGWQTFGSSWPAGRPRS